MDENAMKSTILIPVRYSSVAPLKKRGKAASNNMIKSSSSSVTPTRKYSLIRLYLACSKAHLLPTFLKWQRTIISNSDVSQQSLVPRWRLLHNRTFVLERQDFFQVIIIPNFIFLSSSSHLGSYLKMWLLHL